MSDPLWTRPRTLLHEFTRLAAARAEAEEKCARDFQSRMETAEKEYETARQTLTARFEAEEKDAEREVQELRETATSRCATECSAAENEFAEAGKRISSQLTETQEAAEKEFNEARWALTALMDASPNGDLKHFRDVKTRAIAGRRRAQAIQRDARELLESWRQGGKPSGVEAAPAARRTEEDLLRDLDRSLAEAEARFARLRTLVVPRFFKGIRPFWLVVALWLIASGVALWLKQSGLADLRHPWWVVSTAAAVLGGAAVSGFLYAFATIRAHGRSRPLWQSLANAQAFARECANQAAAQHQQQRLRLAAFIKSKDKHEADLRKAEEKSKRVIAQSKERHDQDLKAAEAKYQRRMAEAEAAEEGAVRPAEEKYRRRVAENKERHERELREAPERYARQDADARARKAAEWNALESAWKHGVARVKVGLDEVHRENARLFPPWAGPSWADWKPPQTVPSAMRFGEVRVNAGQVPHALPTDERLRVGLGEFVLPAFFPFPHRCSAVFRSTDAGRARAVEALQAVMLRFLTAVPPGKVRFTIIDPVGLGENFAAFMHLADYDDALVTNRIWTEPQHIEQRLLDLTEHMENVIQKYLRNQYQTIEEYNAQAGEVAEPFRVLVVANFPVNFSIDAARRLVSILTSGARCGVYTLVTVDTQQHLPQGFNLADLDQADVNLVWKDGKFLWKDRDFERLPLVLDAPAPAELSTRVLHVVGEQAQAAKRVEVPFEFIAPAPEQWWTGDSRSGIDVPLGRAGATKRQHLQLGRGTSQHVLIGGKTGSGKSTLLHILVTNLSLLYSPDEVELYLVDFKKGVEFKTYAVNALPHARVIAVESEREFGLSVLQRLDAELKLRGERFRDAGVQDLAGYREAAGGQPLPRILLVVDEFQEFFVEDDKIAQEASLLLDRLVRQGRAFGIHILLGSQTLGGAYSLARTTLDQMAVRIVLQCSEADAHLVLSKDNSAARLLSRPGEAIYNDANGLMEGNNPFQVVWLSDDRREEYLHRIREMDHRRNNGTADRPRIVFEGNAPAEIGKNPFLAEALAGPPSAGPGRALRAWLGEAIAIKDPTTAVFRSQGSSNLLLLGQQEEAALAILGSAIVGLAAQQTGANGPEGPRFYVLDGGSAEGPHAGFLGRLAEVLAPAVRLGTWRDVPVMIAELAAEVDRRQKANETDAPPLFLVLYGLQRFRDLRRNDDDFGGFSRRGEQRTASPAQQFTTVIREGPGFGVHTLVWCDSLNNLNRVLERQGLREFEMRVLFQISANDSSTLIDNPAASKLGMQRALYYSEDRGQIEKFRPYGIPSEAWLVAVKEQLDRRRKPQTVGR